MPGVRHLLLRSSKPAVFVVVFGAALTWKATEARAVTPAAAAAHRRRELGGACTEQAHFNAASKERIQQLLKDVQTKSTKQCIEDAFDGAVKTHEIGFPQTRTGNGVSSD